MENDSAVSAETRLQQAFLTLLREKSYRQIKVTQLIALASVNRSTFYKKYKSVPQMFEQMQAALCDRVQTLPLDAPQTADELRGFARRLFEALLDESREQIILLGGPNGDVRLFWFLGEAMQRRLQREAAAISANDPDVQKNLAAAPGFFASLFCYLAYREEMHIVGTLLLEVAYDFEISYFENAAAFLAAQRGGSAQFHYDLLLAYVKHFDAFVPSVTVTQLLGTAGISRTEFYQYYRNLEDFHKLYGATLLACATRYVARVCVCDAPAAVRLVDRFFEINYQFVQNTIRRTENSGDMIFYVTFLIGAVYELMTQTTPRFFDEQTQLPLLFLIGATVSYVMTYYRKGIDRAALQARLSSLDGLRSKLMQGEDRPHDGT